MVLPRRPATQWGTQLVWIGHYFARYQHIPPNGNITKSLSPSKGGVWLGDMLGLRRVLLLAAKLTVKDATFRGPFRKEEEESYQSNPKDPCMVYLPTSI